jgi:hypothetical protein
MIEQSIFMFGRVGANFFSLMSSAFCDLIFNFCWLFNKSQSESITDLANLGFVSSNSKIVVVQPLLNAQIVNTLGLSQPSCNAQMEKMKRVGLSKESNLFL